MITEITKINEINFLAVIILRCEFLMIVEELIKELFIHTTVLFIIVNGNQCHILEHFKTINLTFLIKQIPFLIQKNRNALGYMSIAKKHQTI